MSCFGGDCTQLLDGIASHVITAVVAVILTIVLGGALVRKAGARVDPPVGGTRRKKEEVEEVEESLVRVSEQEEVLLREQCTRNIQFLGEEQFAKVRSSFVVIVDLGGTGSHAAHMLARSGVGRMRLVDFDQVSLSSLNRHAVATRADVGKPKTTVLRDHLLKIVPNVQLEVVTEAIDGHNCAELLEGRPDLVIDCIDNVPSKVELLAYCVKNQLPVLCCAGAGCRADPTRLRISDLSDTENDGLLRHTRYELAKKHQIRSGITCLFSIEKPVQKLMPLNECQEEDPSAYQAMPDLAMRVRIVPVLGPLPAVFGNALAMHAITMLTSLEGVRPLGVTPFGRKAFEKLLFGFRRSEAKYFKHEAPVPKEKWITAEDLHVVVDDIFGGHGAFSADAGNKVTKLCVVRWDKAKQPAIDNLVLLTKADVERHFSKEGFEAWPPAFVEAVSSALANGTALVRQQWE